MIPSGNQTWLARKPPIYFDALPSELNLHRYFRFRISQFISESIPPVSNLVPHLLVWTMVIAQSLHHSLHRIESFLHLELQLFGYCRL
jgi:hypothetical protein